MCKFMIFLLALLVATFCLHSEAKVFTRCELALELFLQGFPMDQLRDWVCLVETVSNADTAAVGPPVGDSRDWGLFQINDRYWCSTGNSPGKDCNVRCADLLSDDITKASDCAKMVYKRHNFEAWFGWTANCKGKPLPDISNCCL